MSDLVPVEDTDPDMSCVRPKQVPARAQVERLVRRHGQDIGADIVAGKVGVSRRHAARLLADVRRPRVVER
jgi:hypothetical protein